MDDSKQIPRPVFNIPSATLALPPSWLVPTLYILALPVPVVSVFLCIIGLGSLALGLAPTVSAPEARLTMRSSSGALRYWNSELGSHDTSA